MGSPPQELGREGGEVRHTVTLTTPFHISATEITNRQYKELAQWAYDHGHCTSTSASLLDALDGSTMELLDLDDVECEIAFDAGTFTVDAGKEDHPVIEVTWYGAAAYCDRLSLQAGLPRAYDHDSWECNGHHAYGARGYRLPTEAEWEYACRAGSATAFANGEITNTDCSDPLLAEIAWYCGADGGGHCHRPAGDSRRPLDRHRDTLPLRLPVPPPPAKQRCHHRLPAGAVGRLMARGGGRAPCTWTRRPSG